MDSIEYMEEMDNPTTMRAILSKLPYKLKEKWRTSAYDLQEKNGQRARFTDLVDFIDHQARIISHPLFGNLKETSSTSSGRRTPGLGPVLYPLNVLRESRREEWLHHQRLTRSKRERKTLKFSPKASVLSRREQIRLL